MAGQVGSAVETERMLTSSGVTMFSSVERLHVFQASVGESEPSREERGEEVSCTSRHHTDTD